MVAGTPRYAFPQAAGKASGEEEAEARPIEVKLYDLELLDQDGRKVRFASDVVGDRIVVIDTFFTTCGLICPILSAIYADLHPRLKEFAGKWEAKPGWVFLTGQKQTVDRVLEGLGFYSADFAAHPAAIVVGDGKSGEWTRYYEFASPEQLLGRVDELSAARRANAR